MWTDNLKVGDLLVRKIPDVSNEKYGIILEVRETNRPTYGTTNTDTARHEFKIWRQGDGYWRRWSQSWIQDVEIRALWRKP